MDCGFFVVARGGIAWKYRLSGGMFDGMSGYRQNTYRQNQKGSDPAIKKAKPNEKPYKLADEAA